MFQEMMVAGGGGGSETLLWTNASSTSDFASQDVSLTGGQVSDFTELKVVYRIDKSASSKEHYVKFDVVNFADSGNENRVAIGGQDSAGSFGRLVIYKSESQITFGGGLGLYSATVNNSKLIPLYIYGVK